MLRRLGVLDGESESLESLRGTIEHFVRGKGRIRRTLKPHADELCVEENPRCTSAPARRLPNGSNARDWESGKPRSRGSALSRELVVTQCTVCSRGSCRHKSETLVRLPVREVDRPSRFVNFLDSPPSLARGTVAGTSHRMRQTQSTCHLAHFTRPQGDLRECLSLIGPVDVHEHAFGTPSLVAMYAMCLPSGERSGCRSTRASEPSLNSILVPSVRRRKFCHRHQRDIRLRRGG